MHERGITDALTVDRHFQQADFMHFSWKPDSISFASRVVWQAMRIRMKLDRVGLWRGKHGAISQLMEDFGKHANADGSKTEGRGVPHRSNRSLSIIGSAYQVALRRIGAGVRFGCRPEIFRRDDPETGAAKMG